MASLAAPGSRPALVALIASAAVVAVAYPLAFVPAVVALGLAWCAGAVLGRLVGGSGRIVGAAASIAPALAAPAFMPLTDLTQILILGIAALGLSVIVGWGGELNLAQGTVMGLGAYATAILSADHGWPPIATIPIAAAICGLVGLILGLVALRFEGVFIAILTMSFALVVPILIKYFDSFTGGPFGMSVPDAALPGEQSRAEYLLVLAAVVIVVVLVHNILKGSIGLALNATRESPTAAAGTGISVSRIRITAFVVGSILAGIAGSLYAVTVGFVGPESFGLFYGIQLMTIVVVGGMRSMAGPFLGAFLVFQLNAYVERIAVGSLVGLERIALSPQAVFALLLIGVLLTAPQGISGVLSKLGSLLPTSRRRASEADTYPNSTEIIGGTS